MIKLLKSGFNIYIYIFIYFYEPYFGLLPLGLFFFSMHKKFIFITSYPSSEICI